MTRYKNISIRKGVFETNSSSCHSVSISNDVSTTSNLDVENGVVSLDYCEYGWSGPSCRSPYDKACYAATWVRNYGTNEQFDMFLEVIRENTGAVVIEIPEGDDSYYRTGHIDHQSVDTIESYFSNKKILKSFLFNDKYSVLIDNDNH